MATYNPPFKRSENTLAERNRTLLTEHLDTLRDALRMVMAAHPFKIDARVILPDHLHAIWTLPEEDHDFSLRFQGRWTKRSEYPKAVSENRKGVSGNAGSGNMPFATSSISSGLWITSTITLLNVGM
jgi:hypothetical protein